MSTRRRIILKGQVAQAEMLACIPYTTFVDNNYASSCEEKLTGLAQLFTFADNGKNMRQVYETFQEQMKNPEFPVLTLHILATTLGQDNAKGPRSQAMIQLFQFVKKNFVRIPSESMQDYCMHLLRHLCDPTKAVQRTAAEMLGYAGCKDALNGWTNLLAMTLQLTEQDVYRLGATLVFQKLFESCQVFLPNPGYHDMLSSVIPKLLALCSDSRTEIRINCLKAIGSTLGTHAFQANFPQALTVFLSLADLTSPEEHRELQPIFTRLVEMYPEELRDNFVNILRKALSWCSTNDRATRECGLVFLEKFLLVRDRTKALARISALMPFIPDLVPVLYASLVYTPLDLETMAGIDDLDSSIQRRHGQEGGTFYYQEGKGRGNDDEDDGEGGDDDDDDDDVITNACRSHAKTIFSRLSAFLQANLVPIVKPLIAQKLECDAWEEKEAAVTLFGAISKGCGKVFAGLQAVENTLPSNDLPLMLHKVLTFATSNKPLIRVAVCSTVGSYAKFYCNDAAIMQFVLATLCEQIPVNNRRVQKGACSAIIRIIDISKLSIKPFTVPLLQTAKQLITINNPSTYAGGLDIISNLAYVLDKHLNDEQYVSILMPLLLEEWGKAQDGTLFQVIDTVGNVAMALGPGFLNYASSTYSSVVTLAKSQFDKLVAAGADDNNECNELRDGIIVAFDFICDVAGAIGDNLKHLVDQDLSIISLVDQLMNDSNLAVLRATFALAGELVSSCFSTLVAETCPCRDFIPSLIRRALENMIPDSVNADVLANCIWVLGEVILQIGTNIEPWMDTLISKLETVLTCPTDYVSELCQSNAAVTLGYAAFIFPDKVATRITEVAGHWCENLADAANEKERNIGAQACLKVVNLNPQPFMGTPFPQLCRLAYSVCVHHVAKSPPDAVEQFGKLLQNFKGAAGDQWDNVKAMVNESLEDTDVMQALSQRFNI